MEQREFNYNGKKLFYRTKGTGPLVVLLHGFGEDGNVWRNQFELFPDHQLLIPDLPGSGNSEMIDDMSMEGLADVVKYMITVALPLREEDVASSSLSKGGVLPSGTGPLFNDAAPIADSSKSEVRSDALANPPLGGGGAILIGHSMGGYVTLAFAEKYPNLLTAFGLFHSTAFPDNEEKKEVRKKGIRFIQEHGAFEFLKTSTPNLFATLTKKEKGHLIDGQLDTVRNFSAAALVSYYNAMMERPDRSDVLKNSHVPVLFVLGKYDAAVPVEDGWKLCHLPQLSYIHLLENSGHMGMLEEVTETNQLLKQFVTQK